MADNRPITNEVLAERIKSLREDVVLPSIARAEQAVKQAQEVAENVSKSIKDLNTLADVQDGRITKLELKWDMWARMVGSCVVGVGLTASVVGILKGLGVL